jgi:hypothetical protein
MFRPPISCTRSGRPDTDVRTSRFEPLSYMRWVLRPPRVRSSATKVCKAALRSPKASWLGVGLL